MTGSRISGYIPSDEPLGNYHGGRAGACAGTAPISVSDLRLGPLLVPVPSPRSSSLRLHNSRFAEVFEHDVREREPASKPESEQAVAAAPTVSPTASLPSSSETDACARAGTALDEPRKADTHLTPTQGVDRSCPPAHADRLPARLVAAAKEAGMSVDFEPELAAAGPDSFEPREAEKEPLLGADDGPERPAARHDRGAKALRGVRMDLVAFVAVVVSALAVLLQVVIVVMWQVDVHMHARAPVVCPPRPRPAFLVHAALVDALLGLVVLGVVLVYLYQK